MMRRQFVLCCVLAFAGLAFHAASVKAAETKKLKGEIASVADDGESFVVKAGDDEVTVTVTDSTSYVLNGDESTKDEAIKVGHKVKVTHEDGKAIKVEAATE